MRETEYLANGAIARPLYRTEDRLALYQRRSAYNVAAMASGDAIAITLALFVAGAIRYFWMGAPMFSWVDASLLPLWLMGAALTNLLPSWGMGPVEELRRQTLLLLSVYALIMVVLFFGKLSDDISRITVGVTLLVSLFTVPLTRLQVKRLLIQFGLWGIPVVIYGAGKTGIQVARLLQKELGLGYYPVGVYDDRDPSEIPRLPGLRLLGKTDQFTGDAPVAIMAMHDLDRERLVATLESTLSHYRKILIIPDLYEAPSLWIKPRDLNGILGLEIACNLVSPGARIAKRSIDFLSVMILLPVWGLVCVILSLLIWIEDRHSPFFLQERVGMNGRLFKALKFRTMVPDAEKVLLEKLEQDSKLREEWLTHYKLKNDPRITRTGKFLRRFSLDELPQLINVLSGEMSLVGPRPLPRYHHQNLSPRVRDLREKVRPGITGFWQISGRSEIGTEGMEQWDPYYVRNWSLWLDVVVIIRTFRIIINGNGAY